MAGTVIVRPAMSVISRGTGGEGSAAAEACGAVCGVVCAGCCAGVACPGVAPEHPAAAADNNRRNATSKAVIRRFGLFFFTWHLFLESSHVLLTQGVMDGTLSERYYKATHK